MGDLRIVTSMGKSLAAKCPVGLCLLVGSSVPNGFRLMDSHLDASRCTARCSGECLYSFLFASRRMPDLGDFDSGSSLDLARFCPFSELRPLPRCDLSSSACVLSDTCPCLLALHFSTRGLREESVAPGPPPCFFLYGVLPAAFPFAMGSGPFDIVRMPALFMFRGQREESVALGPPPNDQDVAVCAGSFRLRGTPRVRHASCQSRPYRFSFGMGPWGLLFLLACLARVLLAFGYESLPPDALHCCCNMYQAVSEDRLCHAEAALNTCVPAGMVACLGCLCWQQHCSVPLHGHAALTWAAHQASAALAMLSFISAVSLWSLLGRRLGSWPSLLRQACFPSYLRGLDRSALCIGSIASPCCGPLDWRRCPGSRKLRNTQQNRLKLCCKPPPVSRLTCPMPVCLRALLWVVGFATLPVPVAAHSATLCRPCFFFALGSLATESSAMHSSGALARYTLPQEVPVEELAHYVGPCLEDVDVTAPGDPVAAEREVWLTDDLGCLPVQQGAEGGRWLGVIVFTPHFRPIRAAVRCLHHHGLQHVLDVIQEQAPGGGIRNGQICVPVRPQPFPGFGTFLRFPAIVRHHPKGRIAATVIDLRRLGGHMFACLLPQRMPVDELFDFVTRMVAYSEEPFVLVVGCQDRPHDPQFPLHLQDGDLLAFDRGQRPPRNTSSIHHLFADDAYWGDAANVPSITPSVGVLLQHQGERIFLPKQHHAGQTLTDAVLGMWDYTRGEMIMGAFSTPNLEFRGNPCSHVIRVIAIPEVPSSTPANVRRRDIFALCDFRALGFSPRIVHTSVPILHMPSVAATFDICVPQGLRLRTWEGTNTGDEVTFEGHAILTFFAEEEAPPVEAQSLFINLSDAEDEDFDWSLRSYSAFSRVDRRSPQRPHGRTQDRSRSRSQPRTEHCLPAFKDLSGYLGPGVDTWFFGFKQAACFPGPREITPAYLCLDATEPIWPHDQWAWHGLVPFMSKLLSEPTSHSAAERERVEVARDFVEDDGRPWPYVPSDDPFALQGVLNQDDDLEHDMEVGVGATFVVGLLAPEYQIELVSLTLAAPVSLEEAFLAIQETRDPISARLFPWLILIDPQPAQGYGILLALPGWAAQDTVICLDSSGIDGRLFVAGAPVAADRGILLDLAGLSPHDIFDVYVGASPVAMREDAVADLHSGLCIFYTHRHALPGPFFQLRDTLLTSDVWEDDPAIPRGPDEEHLCVVWDMGHRRIRLGETRFQADPEAAAQLAGLAASAVVSRLAAPAVTDASVAGFSCWNACAIAPLTDSDASCSLPCIAALLDCRAMLQGWSLLTSANGRICQNELEEELSTFAPAGWEVHIEGLRLHDGFYHFGNGQTGFASFVPIRDNDDVSLEADAIAQHLSAAEDDASDSAEDLSAPSSSSSSLRHRSRSPYRHSSDAASSSDTTQRAPFLILSQEYAPELVCVSLHAAINVATALAQAQAGRDRDAVARFSVLVPVDPQPFAAFALIVAMPSWSNDTFVVFDLSKITGAVFCWLSSPHLTRASILAISGVPDAPGLEVYVPGQDLPLGPTEVCRLRSGACISVIPPSCQSFVVADLGDMLLSTEGWNTDAPLPCVPGEFLHMLTDGGPCSIVLRSQPVADLREDVCSALSLPDSSVVLQLAEPPLDDYSDSGMLGWNILAVTQDHAQDLRLGRGCAYFLDLRPILCGVAWAYAEAGRVSVALIRRQCARPEVGRPSGACGRRSPGCLG